MTQHCTPAVVDSLVETGCLKVALKDWEQLPWRQNFFTWDPSSIPPLDSHYPMEDFELTILISHRHASDSAGFVVVVMPCLVPKLS